MSTYNQMHQSKGQNPWRQECIPVGCVLSTAVAISGGVSAWGVSAQWGVCSGELSAWGSVYLGAVCAGGCLPTGMSARGCLPRGGVCPGGCTPPSCGQTDACENITFPQLLLRTVTIAPLVCKVMITWHQVKLSCWHRH